MDTEDEHGTVSASTTDSTSTHLSPEELRGGLFYSVSEHRLDKHDGGKTVQKTTPATPEARDGGQGGSGRETVKAQQMSGRPQAKTVRT